MHSFRPRRRRARSLAATLLALALTVLAAPLAAAPDPLQPAASGGIALVSRALDRLDQHRRLMILGAHPDDEDDTLLTVASLGEGIEVAYLSLTRGEGGQNVIGPELGESLGVLRSEELLAGRRLDLGHQLFTRAYDFGYTESMAESFALWPREELLVDVVRAIRRFRPQVLVAVFPADPRAGHGQHQASGALADDALRLAGDPTAFPELNAEGLLPWQPEAFFRESWWNPQEATLELSSQRLDALSGHTLYQLAMTVRSQHRSQSMGQLEALEGRPVRLRRETPAPAPAAGEGLFAGIDTRLEALARLLPAGAEQDQLRTSLADAEAAVGEARRVLTPARLEDTVAPLARALRDLRAASTLVAVSPSGTTPDAISLAGFLAEKERIATDALAAAAGLVVDATTDRAEIVPGDELTVTARVLAGGSRGVRVHSLTLESPASWAEPTAVALSTPNESAAPVAGSASGGAPAAVTPMPPLAPPPATTTPAPEATPAADTTPGAPGASEEAAGVAAATEPIEPVANPAVAVAPGALLARTARVTISSGAPPTAPYFLQHSRQGDLYDWSAVPPDVRGEPFEPPPLALQAEIELDEAAGADVAPGEGDTAPLLLHLTREVVAVAKSLDRGEVRRPLRAVPAVEVAVAQGLLPWPLADIAPRQVSVTLTAHQASQGQVNVLVPEGWPAVPPVPFRLAAGEARTLGVPVAPPQPLEPGRTSLEVSAVTDEGGRYAAAYPLVDYEHIRPRPVPIPSRVAISAFPLTLPPLGKVGYVRGAADRVPEALAAVGVPLEVLPAADLLARDLLAYDALVIGPRAYDASPELAAANPRLLDFVRRGGLLLVQSQRADYFSQRLAPLPLTMARGNATRTTDETAPVRLLAPDHEVFTSPNPIGDADWGGWVQERGLYYPEQWDPAYVPLLAMADPGKPELSGALLVAPYGKGTFVYTGLAFFRQLPAGVPGAYRLFANLLGLARPRVQSEDLPTEEQ